MSFSLSVAKTKNRVGIKLHILSAEVMRGMKSKGCPVAQGEGEKDKEGEGEGGRKDGRE